MVQNTVSHVGQAGFAFFYDKEYDIMSELLMPKAVTIWLIDNTVLSFAQIADFTGLHVLEVQAIADGEVANNIHPINPVQDGILTQQELDRCQADSTATLQAIKLDLPKRKRTPRYTPISKRAAKPHAIAWVLKHHKEITDADIMRLIGTTKSTILKVKNNMEYKNQKANNPESPVELGLCTKNELDALVSKYQNVKDSMDTQNS